MKERKGWCRGEPGSPFAWVTPVYAEDMEPGGVGQPAWGGFGERTAWLQWDAGRGVRGG